MTCGNEENSMIKSKYTWDVKSPENEITEDVSLDLKLTPIVKKILESKEITDKAAIDQLLKINKLCMMLG